ncbi:MAG: hypothetical protein ACLSGB_05115 [Dorea sp.]|uniref:hypothetical protein n=1 Tax=Dorea sp. TaxID=2040332 RepID=UPI0039946E4F
MKIKRKREMTRQEYRESLERIGKLETPEEARAFHREMRKYKNGPRLPLFMRYPDFPMQISIVALVIAILELMYVAITVIF